MKKTILLILMLILLLSGCINNTTNKKSEDNSVNNLNGSKTKESDMEMKTIKVIINDKTYILKLDDNETVEEFINLLPQEYTMEELNGNEKYVYINNSLKTNSYNPKHITKGDVMLFGNNCLVIFYKSFDTNYSYTKIGHIDNLDDLGNRKIDVKFVK